jgi:hypothetical protein
VFHRRLRYARSKEAKALLDELALSRFDQPISYSIQDSSGQSKSVKINFPAGL